MAALFAAAATAVAAPTRHAPGLSKTHGTATILGLSLLRQKSGARLLVRCSGPVRATVSRSGAVVILSIPGSRLGRVPHLIRSGRGGVVEVRARPAAAGDVRFRMGLAPGYRTQLVASGRRGTVQLDVVPAASTARATPVKPAAVALRESAPVPAANRAVKSDDSAGGTPARISNIHVKSEEDGTEVGIWSREPLSPTTRRLAGRRPRFLINFASARLAIAGVPRPPSDSPLLRIRASQVSDSPAACQIILDLKPGASVEVDRDRSGPCPTSLFRLHVRSRQAQRAIAARRKRGPVIAIDPGHGGLDSGAINTALGLQEKDVTLDIARRAQGLLERAGYRVVMSRTGDERLKPDQRKEWLAGLHAAVLVSIHCDSIDDRAGWSGATTYYHAGSAPGQQLAADIQQALIGATGATDRGIRPDNSRYEGGFYMLRDSRQTAVLVETGYISHPETALRFKNPAYCQQIARGIVTGLRTYLKDAPKREVRR
jgi:N-acetylmuramoyl-L-alanine amidase